MDPIRRGFNWWPFSPWTTQLLTNIHACAGIWPKLQKCRNDLIFPKTTIVWQRDGKHIQKVQLWTKWNTNSWKRANFQRDTLRWMRKIKTAEDNNCPPSVALWFLKCVFTCLCRGAAQRASLAWCQTPSLLTRPNNHPAICTWSNYYPISKKYRTITARNPHTQATAGCKNPGREKLAGSSNSNDQTAINQQRNISLWRI